MAMAQEVMGGQNFLCNDIDLTMFQTDLMTESFIFLNVHVDLLRSNCFLDA